MIRGTTVSAEHVSSVDQPLNLKKFIYDLDVPVSTYVPVELGFEKAGLVKLSLLTVPPTGYYEGIAPNPPTNAAASAKPDAPPSSV